MKNSLLIFSYYEDIWIDLDLLPLKKSDLFLICHPEIEKKVDLSNSKIEITFKNIKQLSVWHKLIHSARFYLAFPGLIKKYETFIFITPPHFHFVAIPILKIFDKKIYTIVGDAYSEIVKEKLWQASFIKKIIRTVLYPAYNISEYISIRYSTSVFAVSEYLKNKYDNWTKVYLTPNGTSVERINEIIPLRAVKEEYIYYVGGLLKWRGIDLLLEAFQKIKNSHNKKIKLVIVGGSKEEIAHYDELKKFYNDEDVLFLGRKDRHTSLRYLKAAKIAVLPNRNTLMSRTISSMKVFEYIAAEIPQICTNSGDHAKFVRELGTGLVVNSNSEEIAEGILTLLSDKGLYNKIKKNCKKNKKLIDYKILRKPLQEIIK